MNLHDMVWKEMWQRPAGMAACLVTILAGVAALVALRHVTEFSESEVNRQLSGLGANVLVLPKGATLADYYSADANGLTLPEECVDQIMLAALMGVEKLSPKLSVPVEVDGQPLTLTGILPQSEFAAKAAWQTASLFKEQHAGCARARCGGQADHSAEALVTLRTIEHLADDDAVLGADVAQRLGLAKGDAIRLCGGSFQVLAVLPATGTIDDSRVFAHLHRVQQLTGAGEVVSAIEVMGCCEDAAGQLVPKLAELLPASRVVTISQVVQTQVGVNRLMGSASLVVLVVLVLAGGASVMTTIAGNARQRRREIGTLLALGFSPRQVARLLWLKALWLGTAGGIAGSLLGVAAAVWLGPIWTGLTMRPLVDVAGWALAAAVGVALLAAWWPARQAARLDPCACLREV